MVGAPLAASPDYSWAFEPGPILLLAAFGGLYVPRWVRVRRDDGPLAAPVWRLGAYVAGLVVLFVALVSPLDALVEQAFAPHMLQHMLLLDVAPVLFMLGLTRILLRPATRRLMAVEQAVGALAHPWVAVVLYVLVVWVWHIPAAYDVALENPTIHVIEHVSLLSVGLLYWWHLLSPIRSRFREGALAPLLYMAATKLGVGVLGIGLTFAPRSLYPYYQARESIWGLTADSDQQLAGAIMALEQSLVMGIVLVYLIVRALERSEREQQRRDLLIDRLEQGGRADATQP